MNFKEIMQQLKAFGNDQTKRIYANHGAKEPFYGVKVGDLKKIVKIIKKNHNLSLELYNTGNSDAMYLAGLISEPDKMTKAILKSWIAKANWYMLSDYTVAGVAAESEFGLQLAKEWIKSDKPLIESAGWSTLSGIISITPNKDINLDFIKNLLQIIKESVHTAPNRVKYSMNNFIMSVGVYVESLTDYAIQIAEDIGKIDFDKGDTSCTFHYAKDYIIKAKIKDKIGKKRKKVIC